MDTPSDFDQRWHGVSISHEHWHFHRQLLLRYDIVLALGDFSAIKNDIEDGVARLIRKRKNGTSIYLVAIKSTASLVFIMLKHSQLLTAYPSENLIRKRTKKESGKRRGILQLPDGSQILVAYRRSTTSARPPA